MARLAALSTAGEEVELSNERQVLFALQVARQRVPSVILAVQKGAKPMKLSTFLAIAAVIYGIFGVGELLAPAQFLATMGVTLNEGGQLATRAGATAAIGYAVIFWFARKAEMSAALRAILLGNVVFLVLEIIVLGLGVLSGDMSPAGLPGLVVNVLLLVGFGYFYFKPGALRTA
ncbi:MAG: hypothetical protein HY741_10995 [Chloroflexi bacterium]|nr:hypothetical protein [Chloroflexota bacterium]